MIQDKINPDIIRLEGILHAIGDVQHHLLVENNDELTQLHAIIYNIMIIGEVVRKLSPRLKEKYSEIIWKDVADMRNVLIHEYSKVLADIVNNVAVHELPKLKIKVTAILEEINNE